MSVGLNEYNVWRWKRCLSSVFWMESVSNKLMTKLYLITMTVSPVRPCFTRSTLAFYCVIDSEQCEYYKIRVRETVTMLYGLGIVMDIVCRLPLKTTATNNTNTSNKNQYRHHQSVIRESQ